MYRITKVLNHNAVIAIGEQGSEEYLIMRKGIGFKKKILENIDVFGNERIFLLQEICKHN